MSHAILRLKRTAGDDTWGYPRIDVVAFNIDGAGTALLRLWQRDSTSFLQVVRGDDLTRLLEGDSGDGTYLFVEFPAPELTPPFEFVRAITDLEGLMAALRGGPGQRLLRKDGEGVDWDLLPTFGGKVPGGEVVSWDADRLLTGTCADDLSIEPRERR